MKLELLTTNELRELAELKAQQIVDIDKEITKRTDEFKEVYQMPEQTNAHGNNIDGVSNMLNQNAEEQ